MRRGLPFEPVVHTTADSLPGAFGIELTPEEIVQFKEQGWIVKRGLIPKEKLTPWVNRSWVRPATSCGRPFYAYQTCLTPLNRRSNRLSGLRTKLRVWCRSSIGTTRM